jgi:hypothetical protein
VDDARLASQARLAHLGPEFIVEAALGVLEALSSFHETADGCVS